MNTFYNYVLKSLKDENLYIGFTTNLKQRMIEHESGLVLSTKSRRPFILIYCEVCFNKESALHREKYLKSTYGHRYLKNRIGEAIIGLPLEDITQGTGLARLLTGISIYRSKNT